MCERDTLPARQPTQWSRYVFQISYLLSYILHYTWWSLNAYKKSNTLQNKIFPLYFFLVDTLYILSNKSCRCCYILHVCYLPIFVQATDILPISKPPKLNFLFICLRTMNCYTAADCTAENQKRWRKTLNCMKILWLPSILEKRKNQFRKSGTSFTLWICLRTDPQFLPKRVIHTMRSSVSSFNFRYPRFSLRSSSSFLLPLPRLPVTSILHPVFPLIACFWKQFICKMWPIHLPFLPFILCRTYISSFTPRRPNTSTRKGTWHNTLHFSFRN